MISVIFRSFKTDTQELAVRGLAVFSLKTSEIQGDEWVVSYVEQSSRHRIVLHPNQLFESALVLPELLRLDRRELAKDVLLVAEMFPVAEQGRLQGVCSYLDVRGSTLTYPTFGCDLPKSAKRSDKLEITGAGLLDNNHLCITMGWRNPSL